MFLLFGSMELILFVAMAKKGISAIGSSGLMDRKRTCLATSEPNIGGATRDLALAVLRRQFGKERIVLCWERQGGESFFI